MLLHGLEILAILVLGLLYIFYDTPEPNQTEFAPETETKVEKKTQNQKSFIHNLAILFAKMRGEIHKRIASDSCCICYGEINEEVQGSCGHIFCGGCLLNFWHSKHNKKMACPLCRADMKILIDNSTLSHEEESSNTKKEIDEYNKLFSNKPQNVEELFRIFQRNLENFIFSIIIKGRVGSFINGCLPFLLGLILLMYIVSPSNLLPEYTPILNFMENLFLITFSIIYATLTFNKSKKLEEEHEDETSQFMI